MNNFLNCVIKKGCVELNIVELKDIGKNYGKKVALKSVNLQIPEGIYGILGNNGAGKTTLLRMITNVMKPSTGEILWNGNNIMSIQDAYRDEIGYVPQEFSVHSAYTAKDFLSYIGALKGLRNQELKTRIEEVLDFVNLSDVADKKVYSFSGGMKRRVGIAQAILNDPGILVLDEPTAGLDPKERNRFSNIISKMSSEKIILFSTHIISDIDAITSKVILVNNGAVSGIKKVSELVDSIHNIYEITVNTDTFEELRKDIFIIRIKVIDGGMIVRYHGPKVEGATEVNSNLEDYFIVKGD